MKSRVIVLCLSMIVVMSALTAYLYPQLPAILPMHWNAAGQVNGYGPRWQIWLIGPVAMGALLLLGLALPWLSPRHYEVQASGATYGYLMTLPVALMACVEALVLCSALGVSLDMGRIAPALGCVALILSGNPLGKVRRNFYIGVRTPWTLASERVWYATHRLAGRLMVGSGVLGLLALLAGAAPWLVLLLLLAWVPLAVLSSLVYYKQFAD